MIRALPLRRTEAGRARRTATGVGASVAMLAGALVAASAWGAVGVAGAEPATKAAMRLSEAAAEPHPLGLATQPLNQAHSQVRESSTTVAARASQTDAGKRGSADPETLTPEELSTGPVLEWTEIDPGFADLFNFESLGDGGVLARAWGIGDELVLDGERAVYTDNGIDWTELPLPDGIVVRGIDTSSDRWVAYGWTHGSDEPRELADRVFFTDDRGATWIEAIVDIPVDSIPESAHCDRFLFVDSASVSDDGIVVDLWGYRVLDAHGLLAERGLVPDGETVLGWRPGVEDTLVFPLEGGGPLCEPGADSLTAGSNPGQLVFTPEELGFTAEEWAAGCPEVAPMRLLWSDGSTVELANGPEDPFADVFAFDMHVVDNGFAVAAVDDLLRVQRVENGSPASTTATFGGLYPTGVLAAGSAGVVATAFPSLGGQLEASTIGGLPVWRDIDRRGELPGVPLWLGWSADGIDWGWQSLPDTFGITEGEPWAQLAAGRDFVIARVETFDSPTPLRWFIAQVPQRTSGTPDYP